MENAKDKVLELFNECCTKRPYDYISPKEYPTIMYNGVLTKSKTAVDIFARNAVLIERLNTQKISVNVQKYTDANDEVKSFTFKSQPPLYVCTHKVSTYIDLNETTQVKKYWLWPTQTKECYDYDGFKSLADAIILETPITHRGRMRLIITTPIYQLVFGDIAVEITADEYKVAMDKLDKGKEEYCLKQLEDNLFELKRKK